MKKITKKAKLQLNVKIGGCEAKNDIYFCEWLKVNSMVAPMVESSIRFKKIFTNYLEKQTRSLREP